jgi:hypothetical protein
LSQWDFFALYFLFGLAFFGALGFAAVFGRGAFGFLVGTFVAFLTLEGDFLGAAGEARCFFFSVDFAAAFFGALDFFTLAGLCFFTFGADAARPRTGALGTAAFSVFAAANLNDPEAPLPLYSLDL